MRIESKMKEKRRQQKAENKRRKRQSRREARKMKGSEYAGYQQGENSTVNVHSVGNVGQSTL